MGPELELKAVKPAPMWRKVLAVLAYILTLVIIGVILKLTPWQYVLSFVLGGVFVLFMQRLKYGYWTDY